MNNGAKSGGLSGSCELHWVRLGETEQIPSLDLSWAKRDEGTHPRDASLTIIAVDRTSDRA